MTAQILPNNSPTEGAYTVPGGTGSVSVITTEPDADLSANGWMLAERTDFYSRWCKSCSDSNT